MNCRFRNRWGARHTQALLYFVGLTLVFLLRLNLALAVVAMTSSTAQGGVNPNLTTLLSIWTVPQEKSIVPPIVYHGAGFGVFVAMISSGPLAARLGWPSIFYSSGILGVVIGGALLYFGKCRPSEHEGISKEELEFMRNSIGDNHSEENGFLSALSPLIGLLLGFFSTLVSIKIRYLMPPMYVKRMWNSIGLYGCACALTVLSYTRDTTTAIGLIVVGSGLITVCSFGFLINHIDLSPNFAGILYSFTNSVANVAAILGPFISTYLIKGTSDLHEWRLVFLLTAAILVFGNTCFVLWGTTEIQECNEVENKETQVE